MQHALPVKKRAKENQIKFHVFPTKQIRSKHSSILYQHKQIIQNVPSRRWPNRILRPTRNP